MSTTVDFAIELIERKSVTPEDGGCQQLIAEKLAPAGFRIAMLTICGRGAAMPDRSSVSQATPMWCHPARTKTGEATPFKRNAATGCLWDVALQT